MTIHIRQQDETNATTSKPCTHPRRSALVKPVTDRTTPQPFGKLNRVKKFKYKRNVNIKEMLKLHAMFHQQ
jgi:hypothetical protein